MAAIFTTSDFSYKDGVFAAEASSLRLNGMPEFINLTSRRTASTAVFRIEKTLRDREGEIQAWVYVPTVDTSDKFSLLKGNKIQIFND